jgi:hypothetical protein
MNIIHQSNMDLRDLEYFLAIVEAKSVTLAARRVHVAQPRLKQYGKRSAPGSA